MNYLSNILRIFKSRAWLRTIALSALLLGIGSAASYGQLMPVYVTGQIIDEYTGMPIPYKQIFLESDTSFGSQLELIEMEAYSNSEGIYTFTVNTDISEIHLILYLYDCNEQVHDTTLAINVSPVEPSYYSFDFTVCRKLFGDCIPNFDAELVDTVNDNFRYKFHDLSETDIVSWKWRFGDGNTATDQNPDHIYNEEGLYNVTLIVSNSILPNMGCKDSITKQVNVGNSDYYNFGGHVFAGYFPIDLAYAYLYRMEDEDMIPVDTALIDTLGFYYFYQKPEGKYVVKASPHPNSSKYLSFLPTYFGNELQWQNAGIINLTGENWEYDVHLIEVQALMQGTGNISGSTVYIDSIYEVIDEAVNIELFLLDENQQVCRCNYSNSEGDFFFTELPFGNYTLQPEVPGIECEPVELTISEVEPDISDILIKIKTQEITFDIDENYSDYLELSGGIYPNPADQIINVDLSIKKPASYSIEIYNQVGNCLISHHERSGAGLHTIPLNISKLRKGMYFLRITTEDRKSIVEKLVVY